MTTRSTSVAGRFRPEATPELLEFVENAFVAPAPPEQRDEVRRAALAELAGAELVIDEDGTITSQSDGVVFMQTRVPVAALALSEFSFEKAPGVRVTLVRVEDGAFLAHQPGKPPILFRKR